MTRRLRHVFGPVPSRRLGRSLGVDLVPFKTCTYDCVYCQLGRTTCKTVRRKCYVPLGNVVKEVKIALAAGLRPDVITLAGSGEPTLHAGLGELISAIKQLTDIPVAVLTNGSLLWQHTVRAALAAADIVIPSLDAGDETLFRYVNRPHPSISFGRMVEGLMAFGREYTGRVWLEVFLLGGVTGLETEVAKIARVARRIAPERVQLNTVARPPAESFALPVPREQMERFASMFDGHTEVIADYRGTDVRAETAIRGESVLALLSRRPCTTEGIAEGLGIHRGEVLKCLTILLSRGSVTSEMVSGNLYYRAQANRERN